MPMSQVISAYKLNSLFFDKFSLLGTGDRMRLVGFSMFLLLGSCFQVHAATGYSREFIQCMNASRGVADQAEKCLKKEQNDHAKLLQQNYKKYLKANPTRTEQIRKEHKIWEDRRDQRCKSSNTGKYAHVQVVECKLAMTIEQSNRYASRSFVPSKR